MQSIPRLTNAELQATGFSEIRKLRDRWINHEISPERALARIDLILQTTDDQLDRR